MRTKYLGFTLLELMIVVAILGILSTIAVPTFQDRVIRAQLKEALSLAEGLKPSLEAFYSARKRFPIDNTEAGVPKPEHLIGNYVTEIELRDGALHVALGHRVNAFVKGKTVSIRPAVVVGSARSPLSWLCGKAQPVPGMRAMGENRTTLSDKFLPFECRSF